MLYSLRHGRGRASSMTLKTPLVVLRWVLVVLAVAAWLIVIPIVELAAAVGRGMRRAARSVVRRGPRLAVLSPRTLESATGEIDRSGLPQRRAG
jgi:hypothetical protein